MASKNYKVIVFAPKKDTDNLIEAMAKAGAGKIGKYSHNAFITSGFGNWKSEKGRHPTIGKVGKMSREPENKIEMICPKKKLNEVLDAIYLVHPYETPAIDIIKLEFPRNYYKPEKLSPRAIARYDKMTKDVESGKVKVYSAKSVKDLMRQLNRPVRKKKVNKF
ncbi:MAG: hypothetical protein WCV93_04730 [Candidatus Shapirobacteria bacterium]|jgi:hypothetical protein